MKQYLHQATILERRVSELLKNPPLAIGNEAMIMASIETLKSYKNYLTKFTDQIERRLLKGEVIPATEKIFSIFEVHTE